MDARYFYHSFPRRRPGEDTERQLEKGMQILALIARHGLVLAPEVVSWKQPLVGKELREFQQMQKRVCFTELSESELTDHSKYFGPIALEFDIATLRRLGAVPVSYIPQTLNEEGASAVGAALVGQLFDARYTMDQLQTLQDISTQLETGSFNGATLAPDCAVVLTNTDDRGSVVQTSTISPNGLEAVLKFLSYRNAPFSLMRGVLNAMLSLFYPADDQIKDVLLGYYRQREWRIIGGVQIMGVPVAQPISSAQANELSAIDPEFWNRELSVEFPPRHVKRFRRIEESEIISAFGKQKLTSLLRRVLVRKEVLARAKGFFEGTPVSIEVLPV